MPVLIKTSELQYKDDLGNYHGVNAIAEKKIADQIADLDEAITAQEDRIDDDIEQMTTDVNDFIDDKTAEITEVLGDYESMADGIVSSAQTAISGIDNQRATMIAAIASVAGQGTDATLTQQGVAADGKAAGDLIAIQSAQPSANSTKIWVNENAVDEYTVPTYGEHRTMYMSMLQNDVNNILMASNPYANTFSTSATYEVGDYVLVNESSYSPPMPGSTDPGSATLTSSVVYRCHTAVTTPGAWTGNANWTAVKVMDETKELKSAISVLEPAATLSDVGKVLKAKTVADGKVTEYELGTVSSSGVSAELKAALLQLASKVAYIDENGQDYYDDLYDALNPSASLSSISAVYTQSETVYNTDSLDVLKPDLVVTAYYDDQSTAIITTYTLSGTLTVGTSTITVSYGGKTATFTVTVTQDIPTGYTRYDYILNNSTSSTDSADLMINTGINSSYCDTKYIHEIEFYLPTTVSGTNSAVYGCRNGTGSAGAKNGNCIWVSGVSYPNKIAVGYNGVDSGYALPFTFGAKHTVRLDDGKVYIDNEVAATHSAERTSYSTSSIRLFGLATNEAGYTCVHSKMKLYGFKIIDSTNGTVIADFVPATNSSDIPGVYDRVGQSFHYAATYTNFVCGNDEV